MTDQAYEIREKLANLEAALKANDPAMGGYLREIHKNLKADPDVVTILTPEECSILVNGLKKQTATSIASTVRKKSPGKKAMKEMSVGSDL